jgi:hypothetical protein
MINMSLISYKLVIWEPFKSNIQKLIQGDREERIRQYFNMLAPKLDEIEAVFLWFYQICLMLGYRGC